MATAIGFLWHEEEVRNALGRLKEAGVPAEKTAVLTTDQEVWDCLGCEGRKEVVTRSAVVGAALGAAAFGLLGLIGGLAE